LLCSGHGGEQTGKRQIFHVLYRTRNGRLSN
jgi:hypothetical protein